MLTQRTKWMLGTGKCSAFGMLGATVLIAVTSGCRRDPEVVVVSPASRHEACNPADSPAICREIQKCFQSNTATVVCREVEDDAIKLSKPTPPPPPSESKALTY